MWTEARSTGGRFKPQCRRDMESKKIRQDHSFKAGNQRVDVECSHCVRPAGWMSGGKEWTGRVCEEGDWSMLGQTCRRIKHRL